MSVARIVELTTTASSREDAVEEGVAKAGESLRQGARHHVHLEPTSVVD
jgi:flavin-binding protein dodecin